jgi:hypothetical protein
MNGHRPISLGGGNGSKCPVADFAVASGLENAVIRERTEPPALRLARPT